MRFALGAALVGIALLSIAGCANQNQQPKVASPGVELGPIQSARACASVAQDLDISGDDLGAIRYYERARELDPVAYQWVALPLAIIHERNGDEVAADIEFRRAWRLDPNDPAVLAAWHTE